MRPWGACLVLAFLAGQASAEIRFTDIVNNQGPLDLFSFAGGDVLSDQGDLATVATTDTGVQLAIIANEQGWHEIASTALEGMFSSLTLAAISDNGTIMVSGRTDDGRSAIFADAGSGLTEVLRVSAPDLVIGTAVNDAGQIAAIWFDAAQTPSVVRIEPDGNQTPIAASSEFLRILDGRDINNSGTVLVQAVDLKLGREELYMGDGGELTEVSTDVLGTISMAQLNDHGMAIFDGASDVGGIYTFHLGTTTTVAEAPTDLFDSVGARVDIDNAGNLAFLGEAPGGLAGIFLGPDSVDDKLIAEGDELFGSTVESVRLAGMNNRNQIAFNYTLTNGVRGVAIATVPEPAGGILLVMGLVAAVMHRRRGRRTGRSRPFC